MAFCRTCGTSLSDDALSCANCHALVEPPAQTPRNLYASGNQPSYPPQYPPQFAPQIVYGYPPAKKRSLLWPILGTLAVLFLVGVGLVTAAVIAIGRSADRQTEAQRTAIRAVLDRDQQLGDIMKTGQAQIKVNSTEDIDRYAAIIQTYIDQARQTDTSACPRDFAESYGQHLAAWADEAGAMKAHPYIPTGDEALAYGFVHGLNGDPTGGLADLSQNVQSWTDEVKNKDQAVHSTWQEVQRLKAKYNA